MFAIQKTQDKSVFDEVKATDVVMIDQSETRYTVDENDVHPGMDDWDIVEGNG